MHFSSEFLRHNIFYGAIGLSSAARITHSLHHCQRSESLTVINYHQRILEREREKEIERNRQTDRRTEGEKRAKDREKRERDGQTDREQSERERDRIIYF